MKKFNPGDLVKFKTGKVSPHCQERIMIVIEKYIARRDTGVYYKLYGDGQIHINHSSQLIKIGDKS